MSAKPTKATPGGGGSTPLGEMTPGTGLCHRARYEFAIRCLKDGALVLDNGCGIAEGSALLSQRGMNVVGLDILEADIQRASGDEHKPQISFVAGNSLRLPFRSEAFDAVTCFEVIEHVEEPQALLREIRRVLRPGGVAFVSTPIRPPWGGVTTPYHFKEYSSREFSVVVASVFSDFEIWREVALRRWIFMNIWLSRIAGMIKHYLRLPGNIRFTPRALLQVLNKRFSLIQPADYKQSDAGRTTTEGLVGFARGEKGPALHFLAVCRKAGANDSQIPDDGCRESIALS